MSLIISTEVQSYRVFGVALICSRKIVLYLLANVSRLTHHLSFGPALLTHHFLPMSLIYLIVLQSPVTPLQRATDVPPPVFNQILMRDQQDDSDGPPQKKIPTLLVWPHGGKNIYVEGSWDSWTSKYIFISR
jgi:hypothetical protein